MKKMFLAALLAVIIGASAFAAPEKSINYHIRHQFSAAFNDAENVSWKADRHFVKATFTLEGEQMEAFYNNEGDFLGTSKTFAFDKLPKKALAAIMKLYPYPPYKLQECIEFVNGDGDKNYFVSFQKENEKLVLQISSFGKVELFNGEQRK